MNNLMKLLLLAILILSIYSSSKVYAIDNIVWPMFKHDPEHSGRGSFKGSDENTLRWKFPTGDRIQGSPVIDSYGTVYIGSHDSFLYAINPNGTEKWRFNATMRIDSTPAIASDGTIYFGSWDKNIYAISSSGKGKWTYPTLDRISSSPTITPDGTIYIGSDNGFLISLYPNGTLKWVFNIPDRIFSTPSIAPDGTIYVGSFDNNLYAINPNGTEKWLFKTDDFIFSSPAIGIDGTVYVGSYDKHLYAINPNGIQKWNFTTGGVVQGSPSIAPDGTIYVGSFDNNLYAINPNGTEKWHFKTDDFVVSSPAIDSEGTIYVGSVDSIVYAINPNGTEKWHFKTDEKIFSSPAIDSQGTIYVGSVDGKLYSLGKPLEIPDYGIPASGSMNELVGYRGTELYVVSTNMPSSNTLKEISIEVILTNTDLQPKNFDLLSFKLKDMDGNEYVADSEKSTLKNVRVANGDSLRGKLFFQSDTDISTKHLIYEDVRGRELIINLTVTKTPPDAEPDTLFTPGSNIGKKLIGKNLEMTILNERFLESDPQKYVIQLTLKNRAGTEIMYDQAYAYVKDSDGNLFLPDASKSFNGKLDPGQAVTGEIQFTIPSRITSVVFIYDDMTADSYFIVPEFPISMFVMITTISLFIIVSKFRNYIQKV